MLIVRYRLKTIKHVTPDYLDIIDDNGQSHRISFAEYAAGWIEYVRNSSDFNVISNDITTSKCVALTHKIARNMYIEFFSSPKIKLVFHFSLKLLQPDKEFDRIKNLIRQLGWKMYDMS